MNPNSSASNDHTRLAYIKTPELVPSDPHDSCIEPDGSHRVVLAGSTSGLRYFAKGSTQIPYCASEQISSTIQPVTAHSTPTGDSHLLSELLRLPGFAENFYQPLQQRLAGLSPPGLCSMCGTPSPGPLSVPPTPAPEPISSRGNTLRTKTESLLSPPRFHPYSRQTTKHLPSSTLREDLVIDEVTSDEARCSTKAADNIPSQVPEHHEEIILDEPNSQFQEIFDISSTSNNVPSPPTFEISPLAQQASLLGLQEQEIRKEKELQRKQEEEQRIFWMDSPTPILRGHQESESTVASLSLGMAPGPTSSSWLSTVSNLSDKDSSQDHGRPSSPMHLSDNAAAEHNDGCLEAENSATISLGGASQGDQSEKRVIKHTMPLLTIIDHLMADGCANVTSQLTNIDEHSRCSGSLSDVYQAKWPDGSIVAVKCLRALTNSDVPPGKILKHTARELYTWSRASHRNVLELYGLAVVRGKLAMVASWMKYGSLLSYIHAQPQVDRCGLCAQIAGGLEHMHDLGLVHGDIKGNNVVVSADGIAKITDFGSSTMAREFAVAFTATQTVNYSIRWAAPELFASKPACFKTDVYAFAKTVLEALTGDIPHKSLNDFAVMSLVGLKGGLPDRPTECIPPRSKKGNILWNQLSLCWSLNPSQRPTIFEMFVLMADMSQEDLTYIP
ncbi:putative serine/threonine-protein kinase DDB_G0272254 OS=Dictyostelium discoideum GN=DDB_G0272254 PE=3 SV=1 [Rhizoctonia solani AG-1 IB]|uniref:Putative serine/threonine-protein kinase DDB_G0272254 n=1 Tax=Thanatephorus cucumeris (strain AG1-IB / isolate 7/3/14) TaxID=1108050 RepID=A0A0B7FX45_THACB|nr:putative serine/threonine-protein kinase DDB_G0272254 OS=Dictyostelium discoideum GN=DDB_G0272254 PE=3 SV=1 [Rhizoctonia solani AG-1 IB]